MAARRLGRLGQRVAERRGGADHRIEIEIGRHLFGQRGQLVLRRLARGGVAQRLHQAVGRDRLDEVVGCPGTHRVDRQKRRGAGGEHQDRQPGAAALELGNEGAGVVAGHPLVEDDRRELHAFASAERGDRGFGIVDHESPPALSRGQCGDQPALRRFVVDQHQ